MIHKRYLNTKSSFEWISKFLQERFGQPIGVRSINDGYMLIIEGQEKSIRFDNILLDTDWYKNVPSCPCLDVEEAGYTSILQRAIPAPGAVEVPKTLVKKSDEGSYIIEYDILGLTYWMLNRIEEVGSADLDARQRFPATASHAYKHNYLDRPIVDEWLYVLGQVILRQWPQLKLRQHHFQMNVSHDVDSASLYAFRPWWKVMRTMGGHLIKRGDFASFVRAPVAKFTSKKQISHLDPHNNFDWIMDQSEELGIQSAFYFMTGRTSSQIDADYEIEDPRILHLMKRIHSRGHEIGLHPSYMTFNQPKKIKEEAERLRRAMDMAGVKQDQIGGRMHYLRWSHPETLQAWADAGLAYDSTLGYADRSGFRCGTSFEYPAFNPVTQKQLELRVRPLIVMECSVIAERYMGLGYSDEALKVMTDLKEKCRKVGGQFNLLWHNSSFDVKQDFVFYNDLIR